MRFALQIEPQQGLSYGEQVAIAKSAEANGFETLFRSDHYASFPGPAGMPTTDAWAVLAGLARDTERIGLGDARLAGHVPPPGQPCQGGDHRRRDERRPRRGRRREPAGTTWSIASSACRFPRSRSAPTCSRTSWPSSTACGASPTAGRTTGTSSRSPTPNFKPKPVDVPGRPRTPIGGARPRILVGGEGSPRSYRLAARYADEFNLSSASGPDKVREVNAALDAACQAIGRDPATLTRSAMVGVLIGRDDGEMRDRLDAIKRALGADADEDWLAERELRWIIGTPERAREIVQRTRRRRRGAAHAPGLPALGSRHDRRHGGGAGWIRPGRS